MREILEKNIGKVCFIGLKSGFRYTGKILSVGETTFLIKDKLGSDVTLSIESLDVIEERK